MAEWLSEFVELEIDISETGPMAVMKDQERRGYVYVAADSVISKRALKYWIDH